MNVIGLRIAAAATAAALAAGCGGSGSPGGGPTGGDSFTVNLGGVATTYRNSGDVTVGAAAGAGGTTMVSADGASFSVTLALQPAGATTTLLGASFTYMSYSPARMCIGSLPASALVVTRHDTATGGRVVGTFASTPVNCNVAPTTSSVSGSFDVTHE